METSLIWKKLQLDRKKITTTEEIVRLAKDINRDAKRSLHYLQEEDYILRILRGIFYVKSIEERENKTYDHSIYEMIAMALKEKGVKNWYFGLETALKLNLMTHEFYMIDYVITDSFRTTKVISIANQKFKFIKRAEKHFLNGIIREKKTRYSNPEKTILDLAYRNYLKNKNQKLYMNIFKEYECKINRENALKLLQPYPKEFRNQVSVSI